MYSLNEVAIILQFFFGLYYLGLTLPAVINGVLAKPMSIDQGTAVKFLFGVVLFVTAVFHYGFIK